MWCASLHLDSVLRVTGIQQKFLSHKGTHMLTTTKTEFARHQIWLLMKNKLASHSFPTSPSSMFSNIVINDLYNVINVRCNVINVLLVIYFILLLRCN